VCVVDRLDRFRTAIRTLHRRQLVIHGKKTRAWRMRSATDSAEPARDSHVFP